MCHLKGSFEFNCAKSQLYPQVEFIFLLEQRSEEEEEEEEVNSPFSLMQMHSHLQSFSQIGRHLRQISLQFDRMNYSSRLLRLAASLLVS